MSKKQMSFIVEKNGKKDNTDELNRLLNEGWSAAMICPLSGSDRLDNFALVILEREA